MYKRFLPALILVAYSAILVKVMVFKDFAMVKIGHVMLNFAGTDAGHGANFVPFVTIVPYLLGYKGWIIAGVNLVGNILPLVPIGFLLPFVYRDATWKKSLVLAVATGLAIEVLQVLLRVGIFDIDDVLLNALGVMLGYCASVVLTKWISERKYKTILIAAIVGIAVVGAALCGIVADLSSQPLVNLGAGAGGDLCGGTGGNGQVVSIENDAFTLRRNDGEDQIVYLSGRTEIHTPAGVGSVSDLQTGDRVTLVGGPNPDGSFTADAVFVCGVPGPETQS
jgi:glycopeptide antibiotics resistance protein